MAAHDGDCSPFLRRLQQRMETCVRAGRPVMTPICTAGQPCITTTDESQRSTHAHTDSKTRTNIGCSRVGIDPVTVEVRWRGLSCTQRVNGRGIPSLPSSFRGLLQVSAPGSPAAEPPLPLASDNNLHVCTRIRPVATIAY